MLIKIENTKNKTAEDEQSELPTELNSEAEQLMEKRKQLLLELNNLKHKNQIVEDKQKAKLDRLRVKKTLMEEKMKKNKPYEKLYAQQTFVDGNVTVHYKHDASPSRRRPNRQKLNPIYATSHIKQVQKVGQRKQSGKLRATSGKMLPGFRNGEMRSMRSDCSKNMSNDRIDFGIEDKRAIYGNNSPKNL